MLTVEKIKKAVLKERCEYGETVLVEYYEVDGETIDIEELRDTLLSHIEQVEKERDELAIDACEVVSETAQKCAEIAYGVHRQSGVANDAHVAADLIKEHFNLDEEEKV